MIRLLKRLFSRKKPSLWKRAYYSWCLDLTDSNRALFIGVLIAVFFGNHTLDIDTYLLIVYFWVFLTLSLFLVGFLRPRVKITHTLPSKFISREKFQFSLKLHSLSQWKIPDIVTHAVHAKPFLTLEPQQVFIPSLSPNSKQEIFLTGEFTQRGSYVFKGFRADCTFPMGLFRVGKGRQGEIPVTVYPQFKPLDNIYLPVARNYQPGGIILSNEVGDSFEFIGNREYQEGDDLRKVDWKSWARLGAPVVREYQEEFHCHVGIIFDPLLLSHKKNAGFFEQVVSLTAAIADFLARQSYVMSMFTVHQEMPYVVDSQNTLEEIFDILAVIQKTSEDHFSRLEPYILAKYNDLSSVILVSTHHSRNQLLQRLQGLGVGVKVILCLTQQTTIEENDFEVVVVSPEQFDRGIDEL